MAVQNSRVPMLLASVGIILFFGALLHQINGVPETWKDSLSKVGGVGGGSGSHPGPPSVDSVTLPSFYDIALSHGTDKVTKHHYHHMYTKYLEPLRNTRLKFLEIGLGCDMSYGPGASYDTWLEYLPYVNLYYIEYDAACARTWANETTGATIFAGDQADTAFLGRFLEESGAQFDVIIDDGGHRMNQQITSLEFLWKGLVPGGVYFCEDLQTSYWEEYGGDKTNSGKTKTMMGMIKELVDDLHVGPGGHRRKHEVSIDMMFVDCMEEVCAFSKKTS